MLCYLIKVLKHYSAISKSTSNDVILFFQRKDIEPYVVLYSLIALEKFAQTSKRNVNKCL